MIHFYVTTEEDCAKLLFMVMRMLNRLRLLMEIEFDVNKFYDITVYMFRRNCSLGHDSTILVDLSKIWSCILNWSMNILKIDTIHRLTMFAGIFSVDISCKLLKLNCGDETLEVTKNKKQKIYIIYLTLLVFPTIAQSETTWIQDLFLELHNQFKFYFEQNSIANLPFEDQFLLIQYYVKSTVTLNLQNQSNGEDIMNDFLQCLSTNSSLKIHSSYLVSHFLCDDLTSWDIGFFKQFVEKLIIALSDDIYIMKLQNERKLYLYEDLRSHYLTIIKDDLIQSVFERCESYLHNEFRNQISQNNTENDEYIKYKRILADLVCSFNESTYLDKNTSDHYIRLCDENSSSLKITSDPDNIENLSQSMDSLRLSSPTRIATEPSFQTLFRWLNLIYELKFIFGDVTSKFTNLIFV
ncbi:hypothetical protein RF11_01754 [Thelohanellus kitauei]|uniref:Uncharacterized protein n=1 Tax=Thelohanellus kitauei TaxID=669202 RepID=A0A0C2IW06_THEKT|nr:hypothetical protein RF11_01754 [Thelohanellus kitauei]